MKHTLRDDKHTVVNGDLLAYEYNSADQDHPEFSGSTGYWKEFAIYLDDNGEYVCERLDGSLWDDQPSTVSIGRFQTIDSAFDFFGYNLLSIKLYDALKNVTMPSMESYKANVARGCWRPLESSCDCPACGGDNR